ncbi:MAG TPA: CDP-alcohol phosphatidyltransferase family protein [Flavisolibacter sp.]|jgi:CDP-diacylglycerol--glycerol-3-phosphate 3-phosphatidyltransferase|nr:CDP-alcohol phosphatidyltransferase family protein [Flavisolibacter sp.]
MQKTAYYLINGITLYRVVASLVLFILIMKGKAALFAWLLPISFFTDAIDGFLARRYKVVSVLGARLDSIGDDMTVLMGILGLIFFKPEFLKQEWVWVLTLVILLLIQLSVALYRFGRFTSFHTLLAKVAALAQGIFLILSFILPEPPLLLFYVAASITFLDLVEEIIMVSLMQEWKTDIKGWYWMNRIQANEEHT